jgi:uncharacterized protein (TIGR02271 family)
LPSVKASRQVSIPLVHEEVSVSKRQVETGRVRITKHVQERQEPVHTELLHHEVEVERVPVNRVLDAPPEVREEGDVLVIPVLEEIVEKRWLLKEEVRVRRRSTQTTHRQNVALRTEKVSVERQKGRSNGSRTKSNPP